MTTPTNIDEEKLELFTSLFRGRMDVWARHWERDGRSGYSPAYEFDWNEFLAHKNRGGTLKNFANKRLIPLTPDIVKKHLIGQLVVGIYPILSDNTSYFLAADFDGGSWEKDAKAFIDAAKISGLLAYCERSRSGKGGHVWIFFSQPYPCWKSRRIGLELIRKAFHISEFEKEVSFDRLFPSQDYLSSEGFGNLIALPLQGKSLALSNSAFIDLDEGIPFANQWDFLKQTKANSLNDPDEAYNFLFDQGNLQTAVDFTSKSKLKIIVSNKITLYRGQLNSKLISFIKDELNFLNNEYVTKKRLGKSIYKVQKYFKLIDEIGENILLPRGFLNQLTNFLKKNNIDYSSHFEYPLLGGISFSSSIALNLQQAIVVNTAFTQDQGVIVAPAGSGKTIIGLELIVKRKLPALILVHREQLLVQWMERIQTFLGIPKTHIGRYDGVKKEFGKEITVGLLQSFARKKDLSNIKDNFGTIIIDECHHIPAKTFREVVTQLNPRFIYGLTATPTRKHNDEKLIYDYIGDIVARMEGQGDSQVIPQIQPKPIQVTIKTTNLAIPFKFKTDYFNLLAKVISFDTARNQVIVDDILSQIKNGKKLLVLSERKEHLEILDLYLKAKCETIMISGDDSAAKRIIKLKQIESGHYQVILSTGQFFGEGLDIQGITCLILAFPFSFEGKLAQYIGRMRDIGEQKFLIDYRDRQIPFLEKQFKQRQRFYKKMSFNVVAKTGQNQMF
jgi:superfamily II DNA or RNA helicase